MPEIPGLTANDVAELQRMRRKIDSVKTLRGLECKHTPAGVVISAIPPRRPPQPIADQSCVVVKITANDTGGGKYTGAIYGEVAADLSTANLAMPEGAEAGDDCVIYHLAEDAKPTHWLKLDTFAVGVINGTDAETGKTIVEIGTGEARRASPQAFAGSGTTARTSTYNRDAVTSGTDYGDCPTIITRQRIALDTGAATIMLYTWTETFDAAGHLVAISAETESTLDAGTACP